MTLPLSDGGRTSFARAMPAAGVFSLMSLVLISRESHAFVKGLPLRWLLLVALLTLFSFSMSIFKDFSVKEGLTLLSVIGGSVLAGHVARQCGSRALVIALLASGVAVCVAAAPTYLTAPPGAQAAWGLSGPFNYPNGLGSFLLLMAFLSLACVLHSETLLTLVVSVSSASVLFAALVLTNSRGVWAAALIALIFFMAVEWRLVWAHRRRVALAALLILSVVFMASRQPDQIARRFVSLTEATSTRSQDVSFRWRRDIYGWTLDMIRDHPWAGTGIGTFSIAIKRYQRTPYITGMYAHSHYLQFAAETGLPALAGFLLFLGFLVRRGQRIIAGLEPQGCQRSLAVGLAAGLLGSSLHAGVDLGWNYPAVLLVCGVETAMLFALAPRDPPAAEGDVPGPASLRKARIILLSLCLVMAILAGTRYYAELFRNEGKASLDVGELADAVPAFQRSSRLNPLFYSPRQFLALAYAAQGDLKSSQREAEAAFRLNPFDGDAYNELARIHRLAGEFGKAESEFLAALQFQPFARLRFYYDIAEFYLAAGKVDDAEAWLRRGTEIFRPEIVTSRVNRCLAPGDRYILAKMHWRVAEISRQRGRIGESIQSEEVASGLAKPAMEEICFRAMEGPFLSPESTITAYWKARSQGDWPSVVATFAHDAGQQFRDESLVSLPADIQAAEVDWILSLSGNEDAARVGYELKLLTRGGLAKRVAFTDTLIVERGGWRLRHREIGLK